MKNFVRAVLMVSLSFASGVLCTLGADRLIKERMQHVEEEEDCVKECPYKCTYCEEDNSMDID